MCTQVAKAMYGDMFDNTAPRKTKEAHCSWCYEFTMHFFIKDKDHWLCDACKGKTAEAPRCADAMARLETSNKRRYRSRVHACGWKGGIWLEKHTILHIASLFANEHHKSNEHHKKGGGAQRRRGFSPELPVRQMFTTKPGRNVFSFFDLRLALVEKPDLRQYHVNTIAGYNLADVRMPHIDLPGKIVEK